ncbi:hypothetical protein HanIR_Chr03g0120671 [Helianthus annuus]|nr:hypothetical protein HanIR_Chr03g0120671 [Helianthus annuus]
MVKLRHWPTGRWVTGFSPELVMCDSGYSRSTPFVKRVPQECSGLICWPYKKNYSLASTLNNISTEKVLEKEITHIQYKQTRSFTYIPTHK